MKVHHYKGKKRTRRFLEKNVGSFKNQENVVQNEVFRLFLENGSKDFGHLVDLNRG